MPSEELKPCPFCGEPPHSFLVNYGTGHDHGIECDNLKCLTLVTVDANTRDEAVKIWNTRA